MYLKTKTKVTNMYLNTKTGFFLIFRLGTINSSVLHSKILDIHVYASLFHRRNSVDNQLLVH